LFPFPSLLSINQLKFAALIEHEMNLKKKENKRISFFDASKTAKNKTEEQFSVSLLKDL
jgi:hypothetical protein